MPIGKGTSLLYDSRPHIDRRHRVDRNGVLWVRNSNLGRWNRYVVRAGCGAPGITLTATISLSQSVWPKGENYVVEWLMATGAT